MGYAVALLLTLAVEIPIYAIGLHTLLGEPMSHGMIAGCAVNLTHPLAFLVGMPLLIDTRDYGATLAVVELAVWIAEAALLWIWFRREPGILLALSLVANGTSLCVGLFTLR